MLLDPVAACFTPEVAQRVAGLRVNPIVQARIDELAAKANEGQLTDSEEAEYDAYIEAADVISILQAKARSVLGRKAS